MTGKGNTADEMTKARNSMVQTHKAGTFQIIKNEPHTVVLDEEGMQNTGCDTKVQLPRG